MLLKGDIPPDKKDARHVDYLSSGMDCGVNAVTVGLGQILETHKTDEKEELKEEMLLSICLTFEGLRLSLSRPKRVARKLRRRY